MSSSEICRYLLHVNAPQALLGAPLAPEGTQTRGARRVLVAPHGAGVRGTRLYLVGRGIEERASHAVPVVDGNEAEGAAYLTWNMTVYDQIHI